VRGRRDAGSLAGRGLLRLCNDLLAVLTGGLADRSGFLARLGELRSVFLERSFGALLRLVGLGNVALNRLRALIEKLLHCGQRHLPEHNEDDDEADRRPDDVVPLWDEWVPSFTLRGCERDKSAEHPVS